MSGRRDFSEFNAKFDKHLRRLPDYAQRAQEKLQQYVPPAGDGHTGREPQRSSALPELPVVAEIREIRDKWARWNEPAAKLERRKRRTSRALTLWVVLTLLSVLYALAGYAGIMGGFEGLQGALNGIAAAIVFGALGVRTGIRLYQLNRVRLPQRVTPPPLPPVGSVARAPMERLAQSEASLDDLLGKLTSPSAGAPSAVPSLSVEDARATATEAAAALRALADRVRSIERARDSAPVADRPALDSAITALREQLDDGLDAYGALIAAAGHAVAESGGGVEPAKEALTDATDRLAGLAMALRELSRTTPRPASPSDSDSTAG